MQGKTFALAGALLASSWLAAAGAQAAAELPTHYNMPNGYGQAEGGGRNYWDVSYSGSGNRTVGYAPLTGGLGDLTDGVIATERWDAVENDAGTGPYVGWNHADAWRIEFNFAQSLVFSEVTVWHDDANGWGDISPPQSILVTAGGMSQLFTIADPASDQHFASVLALGPGFTGRADAGAAATEQGLHGQRSAVQRRAGSRTRNLGFGLSGLWSAVCPGTVVPSAAGSARM